MSIYRRTSSSRTDTRTSSSRFTHLNQSGFDHVLLAVAVVVVFALVGSFLLFKSRAATTPTVELQSEVGSNICVAGGQSVGGLTYLAPCNGSVGEQWLAANGVIKNTAAPGGPYCLEPISVPTSNTLVDVHAEKCNGSSAQTWSGGGNPTALRDGAGTNKCLVDPNNSVSPSTNLGIIGCGSYADQTWNTHATYTASAPPAPTPPAPSGLKCSADANAHPGECADAQTALKAYGFDNQQQLTCLGNIFDRESGWRVDATNPESGAYGIPQALPGSKMATAGSDWRTNALTQIKWGVGYMKGRYSTPCGAWSFWQGHGWYGVTNAPNGQTETF